MKMSSHPKTAAERDLKKRSVRVSSAVFNVSPRTFLRAGRKLLGTESTCHEQSAGLRLQQPRQSRSPFQLRRCAERGQPCPREPESRNWRTKLSALLSAALATVSFLLLSPIPAHAQGGVPLWTNRFNAQARNIAVDGSGNVFLAGNSSNNQVTIKYSNSGVPLWTNYLTSPIYDPGLAVDSRGNVVVTGASETIKYSNTGVPLWTNQMFSRGPIALDSRGNVFVLDFFITKASSNSGVPLWTEEYIGPGIRPGDYGEAWAIAVDASDNVIVAGSTPLIGTGYDWATLKYSNGGVPLWTNRYNGPANGDDIAGAIAVDNRGNVFVTGDSRNLANVPDYVTIKYSSAGVPLWTNRYNGPANLGDSAGPIAVDSAGNVFVTGSSGVSSGECCDFATIKYSNDGVPLWTRRYNGPGNSQDIPHAIAVDSAGNVFVTGGSYGLRSDLGGSSDYATIAYSNDGVPLWTNRYPAGGGTAIALDSSGNVFVTGYSENGTTVTIKYSSSVPPVVHLDFQLLNNQLVLSWTNAGFNLQSSPAVTGAFTNINGATSPFTNATTGGQQFFRLISN